MPTKFPPAWSLNQCVKTIQEIYRIHSDERFNSELLVEFLDTTKTSSNFNRRTSALQGFGLLTKTDETVQLTELAVQIVNPVAGEDKEARLTAFRKIDVLSELLPRYPNGKLPQEPDTVKAVLHKSLNVERDTVQQWYDFVVDSFKAIYLSGDSISNIQMQEKIAKSHNESQASYPEMRTSTVFLPSGKRFSFSVETGYTPEDMAFVQSLLNLFLQATPKTKKENEAK